MEPTKVIDLYFEALRKGDCSLMVELFAENSIVASPVFGMIKPEAFFLMLFTLSRWSRAKVNRVTKEEPTSNGEQVLAAHFWYESKPIIGKVVEFDCVDYFAFNNENQITCLTPVFDTQKVKIPIKNTLKWVFQWWAAKKF